MDTNLQKYMAFLKTVEYGSFTKAAEVLHYSQSGISRMIGDTGKGVESVCPGAGTQRGKPYF